MKVLKVANTDEAMTLKTLLATGSTECTDIPFYYDGNVTFKFKDEDYDVICNLFDETKSQGDGTEKVEEDFASDQLAQTITTTLQQGTPKVKAIQTNKPVGPYNQQGQKLDQTLSKTISQNPALKTQLDTAFKKAGIDINKISESQIVLYKKAIEYLSSMPLVLEEHITKISQSTCIPKTKVAKLWKTFIKEDEDQDPTEVALKQSILELLITFRSKNISKIPLPKFINALHKENDTFDPEMDKEYIVDLIGSISFVSNVDTMDNEIILDNGTEDQDIDAANAKDEKEWDKQQLEKKAATKAKKNIKDKNPFDKL